MIDAHTALPLLLLQHHSPKALDMEISPPVARHLLTTQEEEKRLGLRAQCEETAPQGPTPAYACTSGSKWQAGVSCSAAEETDVSQNANAQTYQILEHLLILLVSLEVLLLDELVDGELDADGLGCEPPAQLVDGLGDELGVRQALPALHDAHKCGLDDLRALRLEPRVRLARLLGILDARRDRLHLDAHQLVREGVVEREAVPGANRPCRGVLAQDLVLCARERLQDPLQVPLWQTRPCGNVLRCRVLLDVLGVCRRRVPWIRT